MYARTTRYEGGEAGEIRDFVAEMAGRAEEGPPEGVPSVGFQLLTNPDEGTMLFIGFFETEDDLKQGDKALREMEMPRPVPGEHVSVDFYEVGIKVEAPAGSAG